ncbi:MAG: CREG family protein [Magnetospirillum sp. WYHS-4]
MDLPKDNRLALRRVARACRKGALASLMAEGGAPYASLVTVAFDHDLSPILLLSGLSDHTRNLKADGRASLLLDGTEGLANPQAGPRVTLSGVAVPTADERLRRRFLACHPGAALYAGFGDFGFWKMHPEKAHFVGGFGRAVWFPAPFGLNRAAAFAAAEEEILTCFPEGAWKPVAVDPDGCHLARGETIRRLAFDPPADTPETALALLSKISLDA